MVIKKLLAIVILIVLASTVFLYRFHRSSQIRLQNPVSTAESVTQSSVNSPDGTIKLIMSVKKNQNGASVYSFSTKDESGNVVPIFKKTATFGESMTIPPNTWSPNNKYLFIKDTNGYKIDYLVFKANGEPFTTGESFINATALFDQKVKNYNLKSMTGWDDPVLISVRTVDGPHFWFDLTTQSFIQLAR